MFNNLFKKRKKTEEMSDKIEKISRTEFINNFIEDFHHQTSKEKLDVPELPDDVITSIVNEYFNKKTLTEANKYIYDVFYEYVENPYEKINWKHNKNDVEKTPEYKAWRRCHKILDIWSFCRRSNRIEETWVNLNGKVNTDEEAAKKAADKWCELIFGWHLQDNGAINENHPGGFTACALGTILADNNKNKISEDVKKKAHSLFYEYYMRMIHYHNTKDKDDIKWLVKNLPGHDKESRFDWNYFGFDVDLYCDYGPTSPLYLILFNAGVNKNSISDICPWKTGISIRNVDNAVMYNTYQHQDEL